MILKRTALIVASLIASSSLVLLPSSASAESVPTKGRIVNSANAGMDPQVALCVDNCVKTGTVVDYTYPDEKGNFAFNIGDDSYADAPSGTYAVALGFVNLEKTYEETYNTAFLYRLPSGKYSLTTDYSRATKFTVTPGSDVFEKLQLAKSIKSKGQGKYKTKARYSFYLCAGRTTKILLPKFTNTDKTTRVSYQWYFGKDINAAKPVSKGKKSYYTPQRKHVGKFAYVRVIVTGKERVPFARVFTLNEVKKTSTYGCQRR